MRHELVYNYDYVVAFGQRINRPGRVSRAQWEAYWKIFLEYDRIARW